ncbi:unnamed protein product, partial [Polarella glacialis]
MGCFQSKPAAKPAASKTGAQGSQAANLLSADAPAGAGKKGVKQPPVEAAPASTSAAASGSAEALPAGGEPHSEPASEKQSEKQAAPSQPSAEPTEEVPEVAAEAGAAATVAASLATAVVAAVSGEPRPTEPEEEAQLVEREPLVVQQVPDSTIIREGMAQEGVTEAAPEGLQSWLCCR